MSGGQQSGGTNTVQTSLPSYAQPYYERLMTGTEAIANTPYQAYTGEQVAGFNPQQQSGFGMTNDSAGVGIAGISTAADNLANTGAYSPTNVSTGSWNNGTASAYMDPYMRQVTDLSIADARQKFDQNNTQQNLQSSMHGAFGGSRQALADQQRQYDEGKLESGIRSQGMSQAYQTGANIFNSDQSRGLQASGMNVQQGEYADQAANQRAQTLGSLYGSAQQAGLAGAAAVTGVGNQQQQLQQQQDTTDYQNFVNQRDYGRQNASFMSQILHGMPTTPNSDVYSSTPTSPVSSGIGAGIAGLGLYNQYSKAA